MEETKILHTESSIISTFKDYGDSIPDNFVAFYHSGLNAIILKKHFMMIHYFDRQVHRGYGVFDTCNIFNRRIYLFDQHMTRFSHSMNLANLKPPKTPKEIRDIMCKIIILTGEKSLNFRYWCSRGSKNLDITTSGEVPTVFYMIAMKGRPVTISKGMHNAMTMNTEIKGALLAEMKSTNYLLNCLAADEAAKKDCLGILTTEDGYVTEAPVQAVAFVFKDGTYYAPPYYRALKSVTQDRVIELIQKHLLGRMVKRVSRKRMTVSEIKSEVAEMLLLGGERVIPIRCWDEQVISDEVGPVTKEIMRLLEADYVNPEVTYEVKEVKI